MSPEEMLKSEDIEIVQLGCNLLLNEMNIVNIEDLLKNTRFRVNSFDRTYITLEERGEIYEQMKQGNYNKIKQFKKSDLEKIIQAIHGAIRND